MKRLALCLALALLVLAGSVSFAEQVETIVPGTTVTYSAADIDADNSAEGFIHSLFYPSKPTGLLKKAPAKTAGSKLTGADRVMYDIMAAQIPLIASGERESTVFAFPAEDIYDKLSYTAEDLGVSSILIGGEFNQEAIDAVTAIITNIDTSNAVHALLADMPYELYWFDKSTGWSTGYPSLSGSSEEITIVGEVTVSLSVAAEYSAGEYAFNTSLGQAATQAAQNAQSIVASYAGKPDLEQLQGFKDEICALTSYNDAAAGGGAAYGNPWQLVWVFDGNETTKVVCEGYSKAFKYLVDQSSCAATARLVSGNMSGGTGEGPHMWNIVRLQNTQYLVDVTNCDEGTVGYPDELFMVSDAEGSADTNYTASGVKYTYDEDTIALYGYEALTLGSVTPEIILTLSKNEALYNEEVSLTIEAEGATDARYIRSFEATSQGSSQTVSKTVTFDEEEKVAEGKWVRASVGSDRDYIFTAEVSFDGGETWVQSEPQELTVSILGSASLTTTPVAEEVYKGDSIVIQLTEVEHVEEIWPGAVVITDDQTYVVPEELFEVTSDQIILPTADLPTGECSFMISCQQEIGYFETGAEVTVTILESVAPSVSLTISPNTDLLLYQNVTYTVDAQGADKVKLVIGNDDEEIDITQQNEDGQWVLTWSSVFGGEIEVYAKASFDGGETWISSEKQTLNFEVLGNVTFKVTPDSDIVTKGEPIVIRFSEMDMISDVSNPQVYIIRDGEEIDVSVSDCITTTASEMTCDTTNLEAGTYRFGFWGLPAELGYPEWEI